MVEGIVSYCTVLGLLGFVLGGAFGVFTAGIDTNVGFDPKDPLRTPTAREVLKDMGQRGMSYAKNFAIVGAMFSCTECIIESVGGNSFLQCMRSEYRFTFLFKKKVQNKRWSKIACSIVRSDKILNVTQTKKQHQSFKGILLKQFSFYQLFR